ncbi:hypothetical protein E3N88_28168 [Mikania micrantha]|uniref:Uncharacterized protein n=1 Tax=Mikania micrantha TaxID=192012 RepID=A0A5N6MZX8_9ASTR|nr:hypothetical protein E3N88_28168 [Mikania micrantha]
MLLRKPSQTPFCHLLLSNYTWQNGRNDHQSLVSQLELLFSVSAVGLSTGVGPEQGYRDEVGYAIGAGGETIGGATPPVLEMKQLVNQIPKIMVRRKQTEEEGERQ